MNSKFNIFLLLKKFGFLNLLFENFDNKNQLEIYKDFIFKYAQSFQQQINDFLVQNKDIHKNEYLLCISIVLTIHELNNFKEIFTSKQFQKILKN